MKVVLLAGGFGTRLATGMEYKPKPLVEIGGMPIIWHIMKGFERWGCDDFIVCAGYKQSAIKNWFSSYILFNSDVTFDYENAESIVHENHASPWRVTVVDTGLNTMTGGRVKRIQDYVAGDTFMMTYCDGVSNVNIEELLSFHRSHGKIATITAVRQKQSKGVLEVDDCNVVRSFREKSRKDQPLINGGFMVFEPEVFNYIEGDETVLECDTLVRLASEGQLMSYAHKGFWQCMDTLPERDLLERLWAEGNAPWKTWSD